MGRQRIRARHVVIAAGYASQHWLKKSVARNRSSYAFVTDPISEAELGPLTHTLVWETARPYLYMRTTGDRRLLIGGEDAGAMAGYDFGWMWEELGLDPGRR